MRENMPGSHGEVDKGPSLGGWPLRPQNGHQEGEAGPVGNVPAYSRMEVADIVDKGKNDPRKLSLEESRRAAINRRQADEDLRDVLQRFQ